MVYRSKNLVLDRFDQLGALLHQIALGTQHILLVLLHLFLQLHNLLLFGGTFRLGKVILLGLIIAISLLQRLIRVVHILLILFGQIVKLLDRGIVIVLRFKHLLRIDKYITLSVSSAYSEEQYGT